ncbi:hypothetical protein L6164_014569 [Bauhinia variegata]|uniref:Uncharacterized protein n=1 Tax=Bauhinia variegata TaxID=167791 RepID=A0ACB9NJ74_BAUVA|nr:hypothetical protein L6164_014569 [Bauhinia variegata]
MEKGEEKEQGGDADDRAQEEKEVDKDSGGERRSQEKDCGDLSPNSSSSEGLAEGTVNPKTPSKDEETAKSKSDQSEKEEESDGNNSQDKSPKKPDKILACPRCNSMDTKFCYYNNYNINQPRYFCKACQRYWTAGGTMRNVPVGAGRRKNKNSSSHYSHISISEALQAARIDAHVHNGSHLPTLKTNGKVLSFGLDGPICDSMATVLNLADEKVVNGKSTRNGYHSFEEKRIPVACKGGENGGDDCSSASSITVSNSMEESGKSTSQESLLRTNGFSPHIPFLAGVPWPYPWNSPLPSPPPTLCPPGFAPFSFYPAPFWNCGVPGNWNMNMPWFSPHSSAANPNSASNSPTLGKHSRDGEPLEAEYLHHEEEPRKQRKGCVLVPKTLRIDDPSEAAKSSIWATLGIKNESMSGGGMFKAFQPKKEEKNHVVETSPVLLANPAALSRSINFHENS